MTYRLGCCLALLVFTSASSVTAQWSSDPQVNLPIADRISEQVIPIPVSTSDGGCYVAWFDKASGNYDVYLQQLDRGGVEQWPHNGILISNHPQGSALFGWDVTVDGEDNAVLVFPDIRAGGDLDVYAYKVSPSGDMLWGPNGVTLSSTAGDELAPTVTVVDDGDAVVAWTWLPYSGDGAIYMQRLSPVGVERYAHGGLRIAGDPGESPAFPDAVASLDGSVIISWVRDISLYSSPRHIYAQRFDPVGDPLWLSTAHIYDLVAVPLGFRPHIQPDGSGGVLSTWNASEGALHKARVQRLHAGGTEQFPHNGVLVSTNTTQHHIAPALAYHTESDECVVFWDERNPGQSRWGLYGQRISADGARLWGEEGIIYLPVTTLYITMPRALPCGNGAMAFWIEEPNGPYTGDIIRAMRIDVDGAPVWTEPMVAIASLLSGKGRLAAIASTVEMAIVTWEDDRQDFADTYGQNVNPDGTLGVDPADVVTRGSWTGPRGLLASEPNPFTDRMRIRLGSQTTLNSVDCLIHDASGRLVRRLSVGQIHPGVRGVEWDGTDVAGRALPAGVYHLTVEHQAGVVSSGRTVLLR